MKEYNRQTKRWEEKSTEQVGVLKKRDTCRGGKPHDFVLVIPAYEKLGDATFEQVEAWYQSQENIRAFIDSEEKKLNAIGLPVRKSYFIGRRHKQFTCAVCGKIDYEYDK